MIIACIGNWSYSISGYYSSTREAQGQGSGVRVRSQWLLSNSYLYGEAKPRFPRQSSTGASDSLPTCSCRLPYGLDLLVPDLEP
jgi:hypothetical protein